MANSYLFTRGGVSLVINNSAYNVEATHPNYSAILDCLRDSKFDEIPELINMAKAIEKYVAGAENKHGAVTVNAEAGLVYYNGEPMRNSITDHILQMMRDNFPVKPICLFLEKLMANPSKKAVDQLFTWMEMNGMTIAEDGSLLAYKRVQDNYTSFHDGKTMNAVGTYVEMRRNECDDRSENTCSTGLHFCSQSYLPQYCSGRGRVLLLKIDPADVVSIPTDYNHSKGRACRYWIEAELTDDARADVEVKDVMPQPVLADNADVNKSTSFKDGYVQGYKDGRGKKKKLVKENPNKYEWEDGYLAGFKDGKAKKPKLY